MSKLEKALGWIFGAVLSVLGASLLHSGSIVAGLTFVATSLFLLPPIRRVIARRTRKSLNAKSRARYVSVFLVFGLLGLGVDKELEADRKVVEVERAHVAQMEAARDELIELFMTRRETLLNDANALLKDGKYGAVIESLSTYAIVDDAELHALLRRAEQGIEEQAIASSEQLLLKELDSWSISSKRRDVLEQLVRLRPDNLRYRDEYAKVIEGIAEEEREAEIEEARKRKVEGQFSKWDGSHPGVVRLVKSIMNDPDSFKHDSTRFVDEGDHLTVVMAFRGKNAFGALVRNEIRAEVDFRGNVLKVLGQQ